MTSQGGEFNEEEQFSDGEFNEEEQFDNSEVVIDDDGSDEFEFSDDVDESPKGKIEVQEPDNVMADLVRRFNPKTGAAKRLLSDLLEIMKTDPKEIGFSTAPIANDIFNWEVQLFGFDKGSDMGKDLEKYEKLTGRNYVQMIVSFPPDYPNIPPFVRVVQPRFMYQTGRITIGGSICTDILTMESWNPMYDIQSLMINIFTEIIDGKPRIDFTHSEPYSLEEAKAAFSRVAQGHGWRVSKWLPYS